MPPPNPPASPQRRSRFHFHSDTKAPVELKELEQQSHKRHTEFRRRVNQLDHNVASWTARFTDEIVQRDKEAVELYDDFVADPLERCAERFMRLMDSKFSALQATGSEGSAREPSLDASHIEEDDSDDSSHDSGTTDDANSENGNHQFAGESDTREISESEATRTLTASVNNTSTDDHNDNDTRPPSLQSLSLQVSHLNREMMEYMHVTIPSARDQHLESFHQKLKTELPPKLLMEKTKAAKREQAIFQKFESMAGLASRSLAEENAMRIASLKTLEDKVLEAGGWDEKRTCRFMEEVKDIRAMMENEREERISSDEKVLENIVQCRNQLQQALLEAMADD
jgi:hypothetical protein